jgi:hypothetical protein
MRRTLRVWAEHWNMAGPEEQDYRYDDIAEHPG